MRLQRIRRERPSCRVCGRTSTRTLLIRYSSAHRQLWSCWRPSHRRQVILELEIREWKEGSW